jgi:hypothetical protein
MDGWKYMTKNAAVIPYSPGTLVHRDGMLSHLYYRSKELGRLEYIFCGDNPTHDQFIRMFDESKKIAQVLCDIKSQGTPQEIVRPIGYAWVEAPKGPDGQRAAMCGFAFIERSRYMLDAAMLGIGYWMEGLKIDVIHGVMLKENGAGQRFAERLGFIWQAEVPRFHSYRGKLVSATAMTLEKNNYYPIFEEWFEKQKVMESAE